ncbi:J domain-containing protein [Paludibaculum fermentans]|uniref:DnaJ domain-containing protein n=1 Tax=Paludibaculum fermentans TaxID=1473598 RepID=A0A7S7NVM4_PALFE|nr:J domain-containing protein [Paludibaculum fermentans]QOY90553.1 DnaJ domain-containing protein [Paludibaculum fermentans]
MSTPTPTRFQDHYLVLGVQRKSTAEEVFQSYSKLAAKYHPSNRETRDQEKFNAVTSAYEVLSDPVRRKEFEASLPQGQVLDNPEFNSDDFFRAILGENARRMAILCLLYDRRRLRPAVPGVSVREIERTAAITTDEMFFCIWYLKQRNLIISDDKSNIQITVDGMDYLETHTPTPETILPLLHLSKKA